MKTIEKSMEETNAYSLFVYAIRSQVIRDYYLRRLRIFFNHINLEPDKTIEERSNYFANKGTKDPSWAFNCIVRFLQYQKERIEKEEITCNRKTLSQMINYKIFLYLYNNQITIFLYKIDYYFC